MDKRELRTRLIEALATVGIEGQQLGAAADVVAVFLAEEYTEIPYSGLLARRLGAGKAIVCAAWNVRPGEGPDGAIAKIVCDAHGPGMDRLGAELATAIGREFGI